MQKYYFNEIKKHNYKQYFEQNFFIITRYIFSLIKKLHSGGMLTQQQFYFYADEILYVLDNINNRRAKFKNNDFYNFMQIYYSEYIDDKQLHFVIKNVVNKIINHECYASIDISKIMEMHYNLHKNAFC